MHIKEILNKPHPLLSFEFFPPRTEEASQRLFDTIHELNPLKPNFVSVTYGAGGSTRKLTEELVVRLQKETRLTVVSHLTCVGSSQDEIKAILERYQEDGIENIMALRGDPPVGEESFTAPPDGFNNATELVAFIKKHFPNTGIGVAGFPEGHPETPNRLVELENLKKKVDAGADYICTQMFFENRDFFDFRERCQLIGINVPIIAGLMPITSLGGMKRMAELSLGSRFPARLLKKMATATNNDEAARIGIDWATEQAIELLENQVAGIHYYTLNKSGATLEVCQRVNN